MSVRAKFRVSHLEPTSNPEAFTVVLYPVYGGVEGNENNEYWQLTPSGQVVLTTVNRAAWEQFEPGQDYYVDFTPAPVG